MISNKTFSIKEGDLRNNFCWRLLDASDIALGRVASTAANYLRGKWKAIYTPSMDCGDGVIIINCDKMILTGNKKNQNKTYDYTGYRLKERKWREMIDIYGQSCEIVYRSVKGMLSRGPLARQRLRHLRVYRDDKHEQNAQQVKVIKLGRIDK